MTTEPHALDAIAKEAGASAPLHFPQKDDLAHTKSMNEVIRNAKSATDKEHKMTLWQGIKLYPKAVAWSVLISTCICMEGYDVCLLSNFCEYMRNLRDWLRGRAN
jgi:SP family general alpha glucoside:H+ symporter-like MFS transporter